MHSYSQRFAAKIPGVDLTTNYANGVKVEQTSSGGVHKIGQTSNECVCIIFVYGHVTVTRCA